MAWPREFSFRLTGKDSVCLHTHLSVYLIVYLFVYLIIYLLLYLTVYLRVYMYVYVFMWVSVCAHAWMHACVRVCLIMFVIMSMYFCEWVNVCAWVSRCVYACVYVRGFACACMPLWALSREKKIISIACSNNYEQQKVFPKVLDFSSRSLLMLGEKKN